MHDETTIQLLVRVDLDLVTTRPPGDVRFFVSTVCDPAPEVEDVTDNPF